MFRDLSSVSVLVFKNEDEESREQKLLLTDLFGCIQIEYSPQQGYSILKIDKFNL